jgi:hypothetical protein
MTSAGTRITQSRANLRAKIGWHIRKRTMLKNAYFSSCCMAIFGYRSDDFDGAHSTSLSIPTFNHFSIGPRAQRPHYLVPACIQHERNTRNCCVSSAFQTDRKRAGKHRPSFRLRNSRLQTIPQFVAYVPILIDPWERWRSRVLYCCCRRDHVRLSESALLRSSGGLSVTHACSVGINVHAPRSVVYAHACSLTMRIESCS